MLLLLHISYGILIIRKHVVLLHTDSNSSYDGVGDYDYESIIILSTKIHKYRFMKISIEEYIHIFHYSLRNMSACNDCFRYL